MNTKRIVLLFVCAALSISLAVFGITPAQEAVPDRSAAAQVPVESASPCIEACVLQIDKHGNIDLSAAKDDYLAAGIEPGDVVTVTIGSRCITMPVGTSVSDVNVQQNILVLKAEKSALYCNMSSFAENEGIAEKKLQDGEVVWLLLDGIQVSASVKVSLLEKGSYLEQWELHQLTRTNVREDYPQLSDNEYANFRCVSTTGIAENTLYRSSSPIGDELKRRTYADAACSEAGIKTVLNLCYSQSAAEALSGFSGSYYSSCAIIYAPMLFDLQAADNQAALADGLKALLQSEPPYLIHCVEGKDRTGIVCALLECLAGATLEDIRTDYLLTYWNYNGVAPDSEKAESLFTANIYRSLTLLFDRDTLEDDSLQADAEAFLIKIGLESDEIQLLKARLTSNN